MLTEKACSSMRLVLALKKNCLSLANGVQQCSKKPVMKYAATHNQSGCQASRLPRTTHSKQTVWKLREFRQQLAKWLLSGAEAHVSGSSPLGGCVTSDTTSYRRCGSCLPAGNTSSHTPAGSLVDTQLSATFSHHQSSVPQSLRTRSLPPRPAQPR